MAHLQLVQCLLLKPKAAKVPVSLINNILRKKYNMTVFSHRDSFKISPKPNTDNMGKLFVTLFAFAPALKTYL
jgi:hypothetical protein